MSLEYYKKQMVDLRAELAKEKEAKKRDNEHYAELVKGASSVSNKASYRVLKIDKAASHDRKIESIQHSIDNCKERIAREKK